MGFWKKSIIFGVFILSITGCDQDNSSSLPTDMSQNEAIFAQEKQKAVALVRLYFGSSRSVVAVSRAPGGLIKINVINTKDDKQSLLFMLPDQQHLIEGVLYKPTSLSKLSPEELSIRREVQSAYATQTQHSKEEMKRIISSAISKPHSINEVRNISADTIKEKQKAQNEAIKQYKEALRLQKIEVASLPRNNSVLDKENIYKQVQTSDWIEEGISSKKLYVFFDYKCPACMEVHQYLQTFISNGDVSVRYIPVGLLGPESKKRASLALIPDTNKVRLALQNKLRTSEKVEDFLPSLPKPDEYKKGKIRALKNLKVLVATRKVATPTFVYMTKLGPQVALIHSKAQLEQLIKSISPTQ